MYKYAGIGIFALLLGIILLVEYIRRIREFRSCSESITARITYAEQMYRGATGILHREKHYTHFYRLKYTYLDEDFTVDCDTKHSLGECGEEVVLYIDPRNPAHFREPFYAREIRGDLYLGLAFTAGGLLWLLSCVIPLIVNIRSA